MKMASFQYLISIVRQGKEEFSKKIGGEYVNVVNLVPPGVSPHDFEPSAKDITSLVQGDIFIYNGAGLELWVNNVLVNLI